MSPELVVLVSEDSYQPSYNLVEDADRPDQEASPLVIKELSEFGRMPQAATDPCYSNDVETETDLQSCQPWERVSPWSQSAAKRVFDCVSVLLALPVLLPILLAIAVAVRITSRGPVLFLQDRVGLDGRIFKILKFRSMIHDRDGAHHPVTTTDNQKFTIVGPFLRRWKLDELPQVMNVLLGHMSLVGPRPKIPEHVASVLPCRPGITGMATSIFACEEKILANVPNDCLDAFYHNVVLPAKRHLDSDYMASATFFSDLRLIVNSVLRRWDNDALDEFLLAMARGTSRTVVEGRASKVPSPAAPNSITVGAN